MQQINRGKFFNPTSIDAAEGIIKQGAGSLTFGAGSAVGSNTVNGIEPKAVNSVEPKAVNSVKPSLEEAQRSAIKSNYNEASPEVQKALDKKDYQDPGAKAVVEKSHADSREIAMYKAHEANPYKDFAWKGINPFGARGSLAYEIYGTGLRPEAAYKHSQNMLKKIVGEDLFGKPNEAAVLQKPNEAAVLQKPNGAAKKAARNEKKAARKAGKAYEGVDMNELKAKLDNIRMQKADAGMEARGFEQNKQEQQEQKPKEDNQNGTNN